MHQIKLWSIGSLFLHLLHRCIIQCFDKKWNLLEYLMVLSSRGGLTLDLINLKFPNSCLATIETSALSGTKPKASASVSQWKSLGCEPMVPVNTQQSLWLGGPLIRAQEWSSVWDVPQWLPEKGVYGWMWWAVVTPSN